VKPFELSVRLSDGDGEHMQVDLYDMHGEAVMDPGAHAARRRAKGSEDDLARRKFANGANAHRAAQLLEHALGLLTPASIKAQFERRTLRRVSHRFEASKAQPRLTDA
jgi:hypothetical protein